MSTLSQFFGGARDAREVVLATSQVWTPPAEYHNKEAIVHVIAGHGSGARINTFTLTRALTGGSAGGHAVKRIVLNSGVGYTVTVGAGGLAAHGTESPGNDGNDSAFVGDGHNIEAEKGLAGVISSSSAATGPMGGEGSGADIVYRGGKAGNATLTANPGGSGGGAIGWDRDGFGSADATNSMTGGAGLGGPSAGGAAGLGILSFLSGMYFGQGGPGVTVDSSTTILAPPPNLLAGGGGMMANTESLNPKPLLGASGAVRRALAAPGGDGFIVIEVFV